MILGSYSSQKKSASGTILKPMKVAAKIQRGRWICNPNLVNLLIAYCLLLIAYYLSVLTKAIGALPLRDSQ